MIAEAVNNDTVKQQVLDALRHVMDPEIPTLSVIDLGMIGEILVEDDRITLPLIPTFTACPALKLLQQQIGDKVRELGFENVEVIKDNSVTWNTDRITEEGKKKLQQFGLGIPERHGGNFSPDDVERSRCPHCGSDNTTMNSLFGSTLCRSIHYCFDCKQSFERFKPL
jgi:ring-1,2-phenylacetyl-CoA epoxidase subunit PaaD